jgi:hypothetical protein
MQACGPKPFEEATTATTAPATPDKQAANQQQAGEQAPNQQQPGKQAANQQQPGKQAPNQQQPGKQAPNQQQPGKQAANQQQPDQQAPNQQQPDQQAANQQQSGKQAPDKEQAGVAGLTDEMIDALYLPGDSEKTACVKKHLRAIKSGEKAISAEIVLPGNKSLPVLCTLSMFENSTPVIEKLLEGGVDILSLEDVKDVTRRQTGEKKKASFLLHLFLKASCEGLKALVKHGASDARVIDLVAKNMDVPVDTVYGLLVKQLICNKNLGHYQLEAANTRINAKGEITEKEVLKKLIASL